MTIRAGSSKGSKGVLGGSWVVISVVTVLIAHIQGLITTRGYWSQKPWFKKVFP